MSKFVHEINYENLSEKLSVLITCNRQKLSQNYFLKKLTPELTRKEIFKFYDCLKDNKLIIPYGKTQYYMWSRKLSIHYFTEDVLKDFFKNNDIQSKLGSEHSGRKKGQKYGYKTSNKSDAELLDTISKCQTELSYRKQLLQKKDLIRDLAIRFECSIGELPSTIKNFISKSTF